MVGPPKSLHDLHRVEAQVRVTCRSCKASETWELDALIAEVRNNGGSVDWKAAHWSVKCPKRCASPRVTLLALPFGKQRARRKARRQLLINLALQILREAAHRPSHEPVGTIDVRLALHVLRPFVAEQQFLVEFWKAAVTEPSHPWISCHLPYRKIVHQLVDLGLPVDHANRP